MRDEALRRTRKFFRLHREHLVQPAARQNFTGGHAAANQPLLAQRLQIDPRPVRKAGRDHIQVDEGARGGRTGGHGAGRGAFPQQKAHGAAAHTAKRKGGREFFQRGARLQEGAQLLLRDGVAVLPTGDDADQAALRQQTRIGRRKFGRSGRGAARKRVQPRQLAHEIEHRVQAAAPRDLAADGDGRVAAARGQIGKMHAREIRPARVEGEADDEALRVCGDAGEGRPPDGIARPAPADALAHARKGQERGAHLPKKILHRAVGEREARQKAAAAV